MRTAGSILDHTSHRPWPLPRRPWQGFMRWTDLAFLHWQVPADALRSRLPRGLELDLYAGQAWIGVVPFRMEGVRHRWCPPIPTATNFLELNLRTYVVGGGKPGVWFLSLDAGSRLAVLGARTAFNLPYHHARMRIRKRAGAVEYESQRTRREASAVFRARYRPVGEAYNAAPDTLDHWLVERYCLFGESHRGRLYRLDIHHLPWPLQRAEAVIERNTLMGDAAVQAPLAHFARRLDVIAWPRTWLEQARS